jgi:chloramphenicol 3-O-phosphotransferase
MKRRIEVRTEHLTIVATLDVGKALSRDEVESARDDLADRLIMAAHDVLYAGVPINRVRCR